MNTLLSENADMLLIGHTDGSTERRQKNSLSSFDTPVPVTSKVISVLDGGNLLEMIILHEEPDFEGWFGFCRTRSVWFRYAEQEEFYV